MPNLALRTILRKREWRGRTSEKLKNIRAIAELNLPNLPEEIVLEILSKLPLKYLVRFTSVSKHWRSLIQCSVKSVCQKKVLVSDSFFLYSIDEEARVKRFREPLKNIQSHYYIEIFGSCNGLLLIRVRDDLFLWNPLTKCSKKVLSYDRLKNRGYSIVSGLCFDSSSNEYKAVMALAHDSPGYGGEFVTVGSFGNKSWTDVYFPYRVSSVNSGPVVNENLHWFASKRSRRHFLAPHQIVYFNPQMDEFKKLPMPQPKNGDGDILLGLGVLEGCLCMVRCRDEHPSDGEGNVEVLAMKEYGMQESWTTMFIISNLKELRIYKQIVPLCSTKNGEVLMDIGGNLIRAYDLKDDSQRDIRIPTESRYFNAVVYEESLVTPPPDYNWEVEESRGEATYVDHSSVSGSWQKMRKVRKAGYWTYEVEERGDWEYEVEEIGYGESHTEESELEDE